MKKIFASVLCVVLLASVCCLTPVYAAGNVDDIIASERICPDKPLDIEAPDVAGDPFAQGWEVKYPGGDWIPYDGSGFKDSQDGVQVRYFAYYGTDVSSKEVSNACTLTVDHVPSGAYQFNDEDHWRICADCGGRCELGHHTTLINISSDSSQESIDDNTNCTVCGAEIAGRYSVVAKLWNWLLNTIMAIIGLF